MNKIYQCEDAIEQVKFLLAALKIQTAFVNINNLVNKKQLNLYQQFLFRLTRNKNINVLDHCRQGFTVLEEAVQNIVQNKKIGAFHRVLAYSQKEERKIAPNNSRQKSEHLNIPCVDDFGVEKPIKTFSVIEQQNWKQKMTIQELQESCDYYSMKIMEVEKSFSQFFHVIKNQ